MVSHLPIAITILRCRSKYLFIKRNRPPYEGLWSLIGGKIETGELIREAAEREVMEETGAVAVEDYRYSGFINERLVDKTNILLAHFLIFLGKAEIEGFQDDNREGTLSLFTLEEIIKNQEEFLPSDWRMFDSYINQSSYSSMYEAQLMKDESGYHLQYYREA